MPAAASLTNACKELGPLFGSQNPVATVDKARCNQVLAAGTRRNFAGNSLVMNVPSDGTPGLKGPSDPVNPEVRRIAIGNPASVPVGSGHAARLGGFERRPFFITVET